MRCFLKALNFPVIKEKRYTPDKTERQNDMNEHYPFELIPLPYPYDALEPYIDAQTMTLHHDRHLKTYVDNLNSTLEKYPAYHNWPLQRLIRENFRLPYQIQIPVKNNAGGVYNHDLYFRILNPEETGSSVRLENAVTSTFGSMDIFRTKLKEAALGVFGSGYAWLAVNTAGRLRILSTPNQDTPLPYNFRPVLNLDVWEHAYYLKYQNKRADYIDGFFHVLNLAEAEKNYLNGRTAPCGR